MDQGLKCYKPGSLNFNVTSPVVLLRLTILPPHSTGSILLLVAISRRPPINSIPELRRCSIYAFTFLSVFDPPTYALVYTVHSAPLFMVVWVFFCHFTGFQNEFSTFYGTLNSSGATPIACRYSY